MAKTPLAGSATRDKPTVTRTSDRRLVHVLAGIGVGVVSAVVAVLSAIVSRMIWRNDVLSLPWGLLLGVLASTAVVLAARAWVDRLAFVAAGVWIVVTGLVLAGRPEGDYLFAQDGLGLGYLGLATVAVMGAAALGRVPR